jgi:hypothetical protein
VPVSGVLGAFSSGRRDGNDRGVGDHGPRPQVRKAARKRARSLLEQLLLHGPLLLHRKRRRRRYPRVILFTLFTCFVCRSGAAVSRVFLAGLARGQPVVSAVCLWVLSRARAQNQEPGTTRRPGKPFSLLSLSLSLFVNCFVLQRCTFIKGRSPSTLPCCLDLFSLFATESDKSRPPRASLSETGRNRFHP